MSVLSVIPRNIKLCLSNGHHIKIEFYANLKLWHLDQYYLSSNAYYSYYQIISGDFRYYTIYIKLNR